MSSFVVILTVFTVFNAIRAENSGRTATKHPLSPARSDGRAKKALPASLFTMSKSMDKNRNKYRTYAGKSQGLYSLGPGQSRLAAVGGAGQPKHSGYVERVGFAKFQRVFLLARLWKYESA